MSKKNNKATKRNRHAHDLESELCARSHMGSSAHTHTHTHAWPRGEAREGEAGASACKTGSKSRSRSDDVACMPETLSYIPRSGLVQKHKEKKPIRIRKGEHVKVRF